MIVQAPGLPCELYREIVWNFQDVSDRPHLLALALVNSAWREESQRMLFRSMCDVYDEPYSRLRRDCVAIHSRFLQTILAYPTRLSQLVRSYAQIYLIHTDHSKRSRYKVKRCLKIQVGQGGRDPEHRLWQLTLQALPLLTNLKELSLEPMFTHGWLTAASVLSRCTFQLTYLSWGHAITCDNGEVERFLLQNGSHLQHLEADSINRDLQMMSADSCPALTSVVCHPASLPRVMNGRRVVGLRVTENDRPTPHELDIHPSAADTVKYLSMDVFVLSHTFQNVILLELLMWSVRVSNMSTNSRTKSWLHAH